MDQVIPEVKEISKFQFVFTVPNTTHIEMVVLMSYGPGKHERTGERSG